MCTTLAVFFLWTPRLLDHSLLKRKLSSSIWLNRLFIVVEMTPVHAHSDDSNTSVARDFFNIGYYTHVTDRVSSVFCGDKTDQSRWIMFGHKFPGPSFDMLAYCNESYPVGFGALDDISDVSPDLWQNGNLEFRVRGEDDAPWGDEYPHDPYFSSQFVSPMHFGLCSFCAGRSI